MPIGHTVENIAAEMARLGSDAAETAAQLAEAAKNASAAPSKLPPPEPSSQVGALTPGAKVPTLSASEYQAARDQWAKSGLNLADFDAAMKADGVQLPETVSPAVAKAHADFNLPVNPTPSDYTPDLHDLARTLSPERMQNVLRETGEMAADLGLSRELGNALISHLADVGAQHQAMTPEQRVAWKSDQQMLGLRHFGSQAKYAEAIERAKAVLARSDKPFAKSLLETPAMSSWYLIATLANHSQALEAFASAHPHDRRTK